MVWVQGLNDSPDCQTVVSALHLGVRVKDAGFRV
jgi:hypothetical protein